MLSNNFSLAEMVQPVWAGCISSSDDAWMGWLEENGVTNFAWSSQARGFFTDRAGRGKLDDLELARSGIPKATSLGETGRSHSGASSVKTPFK